MAAACAADRRDGRRPTLAQYSRARDAWPDRHLRRRNRHHPAYALALPARHGGLAARARAAVGPFRPPPGDVGGTRPLCRDKPLGACRLFGRWLDRGAHAAGFRSDHRYRHRPRGDPRSLRPRPRRLDDWLGHHGDGCCADDRAPVRRRARYGVRLARNLRLRRPVRCCCLRLGGSGLARNACGCGERGSWPNARGSARSARRPRPSLATRWSRHSTRRCSLHSSAAHHTSSSR